MKITGRPEPDVAKLPAQGNAGHAIQVYIENETIHFIRRAAIKKGLCGDISLDVKAVHYQQAVKRLEHASGRCRRGRRLYSA